MKNKDIIEKASVGNRQAVTELYEKYRKGVKAIGSACLGDDEKADALVVQAFESTWDYLFNHCVKSEDDFRTTLYKQMALSCRRFFLEKGMKGLPIPQNKNFLSLGLNEIYDEDASPVQKLLEMLNGINRYIFVLHKIAGFDEKLIGSVTGYKKDVVEEALKAEEQNIVKALEQFNKGADAPINLEEEIRLYREAAVLPQQYHEQVMSKIDTLVKPYEKKRVRRNVFWAAVLAVLVIALGIVGVSSGRETPENLYTQTANTTLKESGSESNAETNTAEESSATEESQSDQVFYADIEIEGYGTIIVELDHETAPITVENFVALAEDGFYDGLTFHRIINGFMMQGGDPNGNGTGGSGETIVGEFTDNGYENNLSHVRGTISMARSSEYDSASSQFFIVHEDSTSLDGKYAAFGTVIQGMDIVDTICTEAEPTDNNGTIPAQQQPVIDSIDIRTEMKGADDD